jgi:glycosyltransferase involved in cell wall biosynthesis
MIRVLSVIHHPFFGGPQNQVLQLDRPLRERGFSTLAVLPDEPGNAFERLSAGGVEVVKLPLGRLRARLDWRTQRDSIGRLAGDVSRLKRLIEEQRIDLVVVHGLVNPQGAIAATLDSVPVVWQVLDTRPPRALRLALAPFVRALASTVMTTGVTVAAAHPGIPRSPERLFPFFPPVDTHLFAPYSARRDAVRASLGFSGGDVVIGCVANLTPQKRLEVFIELAESISRSRPNVRFALFGSTMETQLDYAERLLARAGVLRASGQLVVLDVGSKVAEYVRALDVFVATAGPRSEGISTTILEAMSSGVPVVSTRVGGIHEAIVEGETGYTVVPDDFDGLVRRVTGLIDSVAEREALGHASRTRAIDLFDVDRCADVHAQAFHAALTQPPRGFSTVARLTRRRHSSLRD